MESNMNEDKLYSLLEELVITKRKQRTVEERLLQILARPSQRKWMHERVQDQYKHERMIQEIAKTYFDQEIKVDNLRHTEVVSYSGMQELNNRLEAVASNIQLMAHISQPIDDFKIYKMLTTMMSDEYIYQTRLVKMLTER